MDQFSTGTWTIFELTNTNTGSRVGLLAELTQMKTHLEKDESELLKLAQSVMDKITAMSDGEFDSITAELITDFEE